MNGVDAAQQDRFGIHVEVACPEGHVWGAVEYPDEGVDPETLVCEECGQPGEVIG